MGIYKVKIKDAKPQVGIFEFVDDILLMDSEDTQTNANVAVFTGVGHMHSNDIKTLVKYDPYISQQTKSKFAANPAEYLNWPRGRVDYNTSTGHWTIMASMKVLTDEAMVERITRAFHLPPLASGKIELEADEGHYGY